MRINSFSAAFTVFLIAIFLVILYIVVWPWIMVSLGISLLPNPPKPEITYGEFPFRLEYEINGESIVIEDTLICEYDGIGMDEGRGKYRKWKQYLASGNQKILLLNIIDTSGIVFKNKKILKQEIYYDPGPAWYYLGDYEYGKEYKHNFPNASFCEQYPDGSSPYGIIRANELYERYGIKLISWDYTQPVQNRFQ